MKAYSNKWLTVSSNVILTETCDPVIVALDSHFESARVKARVTSCLRTPDSQLAIIRNYMRSKGLDEKYPVGMSCGIDEVIRWNNPDSGQLEEVYGWQPAWSKLLNIGVIINPPLPARVLMDYYRRGDNRKGAIIQPSPHFRGTAFDIGGAANGIDDELTVVAAAYKLGVKGFINYLPEHDNNAIHCDCR